MGPCPWAGFRVLRLNLRSVLTQGEVRLHSTLSRPTQVEVSLHDLAGRRLALLDQGLMKAGRHHQGGREASHDSGRSRGGAAE